MGKGAKGKKIIWYRQCRFTSPTEEGHSETVAWIPEKFAIVGKKVYFGKKTKNPEKLWTVVSVGDRKSDEYVTAHERDHLNQRKASDI